jgi:hypothetical protein
MRLAILVIHYDKVMKGTVASQIKKHLQAFLFVSSDTRVVMDNLHGFIKSAAQGWFIKTIYFPDF